MFFEEKTMNLTLVAVFLTVLLLPLTSSLSEKDQAEDFAPAAGQLPLPISSPGGAFVQINTLRGSIKDVRTPNEETMTSDNEKISLAKRFSFFCWIFYCPEDSLWLKISNVAGAGSPSECHMIFTDEAKTKSTEITVPQNAPKSADNEVIKQNSNEKYDVGGTLSELGSLETIEIWTGKTSNGSDEWNPELVKVIQASTGTVAYFPISRWLTSDVHRTFYQYDLFLPQNDPLKADRKADLEKAREKYAYKLRYDNVPMPRTISMPIDEQFTNEYIHVMGLDKGNGLAPPTSTESFKSYQEMIDSFKPPLTVPKYANMNFKKDEWFARSRLQGVNPGVIRLAKEIPTNFNVKDSDMGDLLEKKTLKQALGKKKLFIIDYKILEPIAEKYPVPAPFALFYLNSANVLKPVAIQLYQKPDKNNPVFTPNDLPNVWLLAKLWFQLADASYQQSFIHLGLTHFLVEGIIDVTHSTLSISHPLFKLLKPHFYFNLAANTVADQFVTVPGGLADKGLAITRLGLLLGAGIGLTNYNMTRDGLIPDTFKEKGVTPDILPEYPYRDDMTAAWIITRKYVSSILHLYYKNAKDLENDKELKAWRLALHNSPNGNNPKGIGIKGIPGDDTKGFSSLDEVIDTATIIITTASFQHAAANYIQYDWYAFAPNQPSIMNNNPPTTKDDVTDDYILKSLPNREQFLNIALATKLLETRGTNNMGDFEVPRFYCPKSTNVVKTFQNDLKMLSALIVEKNKSRPEAYPYLIPSNVPNSIPI